MVSILITAGPTREYLDDVRYLSNGSSGRMGCALAEAALAAGHQVTLILGPVAIEPPAGVAVVPVTSAREMQAAADIAFDGADVAIAAAAVADWRPAVRIAGKPPRAAAENGGVRLDLVPNPDIVAGLASRKAGRVVIGFALQAAAAGLDAAVAAGRDKLTRKQLDLIVVNLHDVIDRRDIEAVLCFADGREERLPRQDKRTTAARIIGAAVDLFTRKGAA